MSTTASRSHDASSAATQSSLNQDSAANQELYRTLSRLHREQLRPVGPIEQTLVETIVHNCYQIHSVQQAEREVGALHSAQSLINLGRLARYRDFLERSTREALAQLSDIQQRRRLSKPAVMTVAASASAARPAAGPQPVRPARSAVHREPTPLPIPRPLDQPESPGPSSAISAPPSSTGSLHTKPDR